MKSLGQFGIILSILLLGDIIQNYFKLAIPSSIIGIIILLLLLILKLIRLEWIEDISKILLDNLSLLFIPAGVGIINEFQVLKGNLLPITLIIVVATIVIILVTGYTVQALIGNRKE